MTDALMKVSTGFKLVYYGLLLVIIAVLVAFLGACLVGAAAGAGGARGGGGAAGAGMGMMIAVVLFAGGLALLGGILGLFGRIMCLSVPEEAGSAKTMIIISVGLEVLSILNTIVNTIDGAGANFLPQEVKTVTGLGGALLSIIATILFLLFAKSMAEFIRRRDLAKKAMSVLWLWVGGVLCYIVGIVMMLVMVGAAMFAGVGGGGQGGNAAAGGAMAGMCVGGVLIFAALIIFLVALIQYASLLLGMSEAVKKFARRGDYDDDYDDEVDEDAEYDEGEDDRPRRRRRRDDDYDDEDEDDRPRRRNRWDDDDR